MNEWMNEWMNESSGNLLTTWLTITYSRRALPHGVCCHQGMARPQVADDLLIKTLNIPNKQSRTDDKGWLRSLAPRTNSDSMETSFLRNVAYGIGCRGNERTASINGDNLWTTIDCGVTKERVIQITQPKL